MTRAQLDKRPGDVAAMFDGLAGRYDLLNDILSAGQDRYWRREVARAVAAGPGERVLDLAAGTGTSSVSFTSAGALCVACDFSLGMLRAGKLRAPSRNSSVTFVAGDALALPFADGQFDAVTISFGLRNVADPSQALAEMLRVTRPDVAFFRGGEARLRVARVRCAGRRAPRPRRGSGSATAPPTSRPP